MKQLEVMKTKTRSFATADKVQNYIVIQEEQGWAVRQLFTVTELDRTVTIFVILEDNR